MAEIIDSIPFDLNAESLLKRVHIEQGTDDAAAFGALVRRAKETGRPKVLFMESFVEERGEDTVRIDGATFTSSMLRANLAKVERVFPFVVTCGHELDQAAPPKGDFLEEFWWDTIKEFTLGCAIAHFNDYLKRRFRLSKTSQMSPGSGDVDVWPIRQQKELFGLLGDVKKQIGVELTPSCLMIPNKSVSGIKFPTETDFRSCQVCRRKNCPGRSAEFDEHLWNSIQQAGG